MFECRHKYICVPAPNRWCERTEMPVCWRQRC